MQENKVNLLTTNFTHIIYTYMEYQCVFLSIFYSFNEIIYILHTYTKKKIRRRENKIYLLF